MLLVSSVFGQESLKYNGPLQVENYTGDASYYYKIIENDTLLDGPFQLKRSSLEALLEKEDTSFLFKGEFKQGSPNGTWLFQFGEFQSNSQSKVVDYEYRVLISGIQEEGGGTIINGRPDGLWTYQVNQIKDSQKEKTIFKSDVIYNNGIPQRDFEIENEEFILVGRFLRNGLAHDEWTSYAIDAIENSESWFFEEGVLHKIQTTVEGVRKDIPVFNSEIGEYEIINLDKRFMSVLQLTLADRKEAPTFRPNLPVLLNTNTNFYKKIDGILSTLGTSDFKTNFKVQVPYFQLDSVEQIGVVKIMNDYSISKSISESLLNSSQLNILKRSDSEALYYYNCVAEIQKQFLNPIEKFVKLGEQDIFTLVDREKFIAKLWAKERPLANIQVVIDSSETKKSFQLPNADSFHFDGNSVSTISQIISYAKLSLEAIKSTLSDRLLQEERAQTLVALEEKLIEQNEELVVQIDSLNIHLSPEYSKALNTIKKFADGSLSKYATTKDQKEKLIFGESLKNCFNNLENLTTLTSKLPTQIIEIDSLYQDSVWNPFMAVVMDEAVKKRIITAYKKVLIPNFINSISDDLDCNDVQNINEELRRTYTRMKELRSEETKKLERKLRREQDPKTVLQLLNVQSKKTNK
ncbi:MAG: hypothetical protein AB8B59_18225 [Maribacter sp.]